MLKLGPNVSRVTCTLLNDSIGRREQPMQGRTWPAKDVLARAARNGCCSNLINIAPGSIKNPAASRDVVVEHL